MGGLLGVPPALNPKSPPFQMVVIEQNGSFQLKNFICDHCFGAFRSSYHLKRHILIHTGNDPSLRNSPHPRTDSRPFPRHSFPPGISGEKPFECDMCDMRFIQKYHLERHKRVHSGEKPYQCERCMQVFPGELPWECVGHAWDSQRQPQD